MRARRALVVSWMSPVPAPHPVEEAVPRFWPSLVLFCVFLLAARVLNGDLPIV